MDTPTITQYYRESDPARRLALLNMSIEAGEEPELNQIRRELWDIRYQDPSELGGDTRADGLIALWMLMEFNKDSGKRFMGVRADAFHLQFFIYAADCIGINGIFYRQIPHRWKPRTRRQLACYNILLYRICCLEINWQR